MSLKLEAKAGKPLEAEPHNCAFCKIINNELPSYRISEGANSLWIVALEGHPIGFPKRHIQEKDIAEGRFLDDLAEVTEIGFRIMPHARKIYGASGFNLVTNIGESAGQEMAHIHTHLIPRAEDDKGMRVTVTVRPPRDQFSQIARGLSDALKQS